MNKEAEPQKNSTRRETSWDRRLTDQPLSVMIRRFLFTLVVMILICYAGAWFISRTEGFAYLIGEKLGDHTGIAVKAETSWCDPSLNFFMENVYSKADDVEKLGELKADKISIYWKLKGIQKVEIQAPVCLLRYRPGAGWKPDKIGKLAKLPLLWDLEGEEEKPKNSARPADPEGTDEAALHPPGAPPAGDVGVPVEGPSSTELSEFPSLPQMEVLIQNASFYFQNRKGQQVAAITGVDLHYIPSRLREDGSVYLKVTAKYTIPSKGRRDEDLRVEMSLSESGFTIQEAVCEQDLLMGLQDALRGTPTPDLIPADPNQDPPGS